MSPGSVQAFFNATAPDIKSVVLTDITATVTEAPQVLDIQEELIAKTPALRVDGERILVVVAGTGRLNNRKTKDTFKNRPRMLPVNEVLKLTSHPVGGVCPFGYRSRSGFSVTCHCAHSMWSSWQPETGTVPCV